MSDFESTTSYIESVINLPKQSFSFLKKCILSQFPMLKLIKNKHPFITT
ncbi:hypothetical protein [Bacillus toyonensis]|nr:hypothetical protein [Bacillus toyonensis]